MTSTSGQLIGMESNVQMDLTDPSTMNDQVLESNIGDGSRYLPFVSATGGGLTPSVQVSPTGKKMLRMTTDGTANGDCIAQWKFQHPIEAATSVFEMEVAFAADQDTTAGRVDCIRFLDEDNKAVYIRFQAANRGAASNGWQLAAFQGGTTYDYTTFSGAGPDDTSGDFMSLRFEYTPSSNPGTAVDGTFKVYVGVSGQSILDKDHRGTTFTSWTLVASDNHACGFIEKIRTPWEETASGEISLAGDRTDSGLYVRYIAAYTSESPPCAIDSTDCSWFTLPAFNIEMMAPYWNAEYEKYDILVQVRYMHDLFGANDAGDRIGIKGRAWDDYDDYLAERATGSAGLTTGGFEYLAGDEDDGNGYYRSVISWSDDKGWEPDTTYWFDLHVHYDFDSEGDSFFNSSKTLAEVNGRQTTHAAPQSAGSHPVDHENESCNNNRKIGENTYTHAARTMPVDDTSPFPVTTVFQGGDFDYPDEFGVDKSGVEREGAETLVQYMRFVFRSLHSLGYLMRAIRVWTSVITDDHELTNDGSCLEFFLYGQVVVPWSHLSVGSNNPTLGFPCAIDFGGTDYRITPAALARVALTYREVVFGGIIPKNSNRFDPTTDPTNGSYFLSSDSFTRYADYGLFRHLSLDGRLMMNRSNVNASEMFGATQVEWIQDAIASCTVPFLIIHIGGYVQGVGEDLTLKTSDNLASSIPGESDFTAERLAIFKTALDANPLITRVSIYCGDHHFVTVDKSIIPGLSKKIKIQLGSGGVSARQQDPADLDDTAGYDFISDAGAGDGGTVRTKTVINYAEDGEMDILNYRVTVPWDSDDDEGLDLLDTQNVPAQSILAGGGSAIVGRGIDVYAKQRPVAF